MCREHPEATRRQAQGTERVSRRHQGPPERHAGNTQGTPPDMDQSPKPQKRFSRKLCTHFGFRFWLHFCAESMVFDDFLYEVFCMRSELTPSGSATHKTKVRAEARSRIGMLNPESNSRSNHSTIIPNRNPYGCIQLSSLTCNIHDHLRRFAVRACIQTAAWKLHKGSCTPAAALGGQVGISYSSERAFEQWIRQSHVNLRRLGASIFCAAHIAQD